MTPCQYCDKPMTHKGFCSKQCANDHQTALRTAISLAGMGEPDPFTEFIKGFIPQAATGAELDRIATNFGLAIEPGETDSNLRQKAVEYLKKGSF